MSLLVKCDPSRWANFINIADDATFKGSGPEADLFVGRDQSVTLTIDNGTSVQFKDVVVLGKLLIKSSDLENTAVKAKVVVNDLFCVGNMRVNNVELKSIKFFVGNFSEFRSEVRELFLWWRDVQKESAEQAGLKAILL